MTDRADSPPPSGDLPSGDLSKRVVSAVVMAALAIGAVVLGGWPFVLFWAAAAIGVFWEWSTITAGNTTVRVTGDAMLALAALAAGFGRFDDALATLAIGAVLLVVPDSFRRGMNVRRVTWRDQAWWIGGIAYAGVALLAPVVLRRDPDFGLVAILFLFAVVWSTDVMGYFVGRAIGGPRLAPPISPNKTWSGACGGVLGAVVAGVAVVTIAGGVALLPAAVVAVGLSVASQSGDLFESAVKRLFGVKDASHVIPGHGGLMDRLDGFIAASGVAALVGVMRGGLDAPARGFLLW